jgi:hypothetical protein
MAPGISVSSEHCRVFVSLLASRYISCSSDIVSCILSLNQANASSGRQPESGVVPLRHFSVVEPKNQSVWHSRLSLKFKVISMLVQMEGNENEKETHLCPKRRHPLLGLFSLYPCGST